MTFCSCCDEAGCAVANVETHVCVVCGQPCSCDACALDALTLTPDQNEDAPALVTQPGARPEPVEVPMLEDSTEGVEAPNEATFADGLRALADLLDEHPDLVSYPSFDCSVFVKDAEEMTAVRRRVGGMWRKQAFGDQYFALIRDLGGNVCLSINAQRANVCERVQTGTETVEVPDPELVKDIPLVTVEQPVYEWVCPESLLAEVTS